MVGFYGFHVGKYTVRPMDRMGMVALCENQGNLCLFFSGSDSNVDEDVFRWLNRLSFLPISKQKSFNYARWCFQILFGNFHPEN